MSSSTAHRLDHGSDQPATAISPDAGWGLLAVPILIVAGLVLYVLLI
ncbi:MAG TPA: hypothetical protein VFP89_06250 [Propionibacteriaceae bacterium]|nr:hypothetical protein [Propionibacteriaceae bacterium]